MIQHEETPGSNKTQAIRVVYFIAILPLIQKHTLPELGQHSIYRGDAAQIIPHLLRQYFLFLTHAYDLERLWRGKCLNIALGESKRAAEKQSMSCQRIGTWHVRRRETVVTVSIRFEPSSYPRLTSYMWSGCVLFYCFTQNNARLLFVTT